MVQVREREAIFNLRKWQFYVIFMVVHFLPTNAWLAFLFFLDHTNVFQKILFSTPFLKGNPLKSEVSKEKSIAPLYQSSHTKQTYVLTESLLLHIFKGSLAFLHQSDSVWNISEFKIAITEVTSCIFEFFPKGSFISFVIIFLVF